MHRFTMLLILFSLGLFSLSAGCTPDPGTEPTMDDTVAPADPHVTTDVLDEAAPELEEPGDGAEEEQLADEADEPGDLDAAETEET